VTNVPINIPISGLTVGQTYHYRCVAMNPEGVSYGANRAFITQTFGEAYNFTGFHYTDAAWGDYDNDRDLDLILTGTSNGSLSNSVTRLYRNLGDGTFGLVTSQLPPLGAGLARWGDFDNDGRLDLLVMGHTDASNRVCQIRRSNGNGTFTDVGADLPGMSLGAAAWGDYDRDGDLDLIVTGTTNGLASGIRSRLLHNNGDLTFSNGPTVGAVARSAVAWADIDNDGDLDLALAGLTPGNTVVAQIIRNTGTGFSFVTNLTGVRDASVAWGDYDGDGDPDLVLTGTTNVSGAIISGICQIWRNDGMAGFALVNTGLPGITGGNAVWGDYDNDGDLDLAIVGARTNGAPAAILYRNDGDHTFTSHIAIPGIQLGSAAWGDFDNDGDLDLAVVGTNQSGAIAHIRQNDSFPANTLPTAPSNLVASSTATSATFSWSAPNDEQTPPDALTYNIRINGGLVDPQADLNTGYRKLPAVGNREHGTNATLILTNFPGGTYTWSVQAIDTAFAGGAFAPNAILELVGRPNVVSTAVLNLTTESATLRALVNPGGRNTTASFDFGADTNYGTELGVTNIGNAFSNILVFTDVEGLLPDTVYHFRATALNVLGTDASADVAFRTLFFSVAPSPLEVTLPPGAATNVSITLSNHIASAVTITNRFRTPIPTWAAVLNPTFVLAANSSSEVNLLLDATGLMPATYQATLEVVSGSAHAVATVLVRLTVLAAEPAQINSIALQPNGSVLLAFTGTSGYTQTVFASTNLEDWTAIGPATQISPGQFQFTDPGATNFTQRFYKVRTL
jgi:predicted nucleotidyltransferase